MVQSNIGAKETSQWLFEYASLLVAMAHGMFSLYVEKRLDERYDSV